MMATIRPAALAPTRLVKSLPIVVKVTYTSPATKEAKTLSSGQSPLTCLPAERFGLMLPIREIAVFSLRGIVEQALRPLSKSGQGRLFTLGGPDLPISRASKTRSWAFH